MYTVETKNGCVGLGDMNNSVFRALMECLNDEPKKAAAEECIPKEFIITKIELYDIIEDFRKWVSDRDGGRLAFFFFDDAEDDEPSTNKYVDKFVEELSKLFPELVIKASPIRYICDGECATFDIVIDDGKDIRIESFETS